MDKLGRHVFVDAENGEDAIQKGAASLGIPPDQMQIKSQKTLSSGLIRFELFESEKTRVPSISELLERADFQLGNIQTEQFIKGYSSIELEDKGLLSEVDEIENSVGRLSRRFTSFEIPSGVECCECEALHLQDFSWLEAVQKVKPCSRGAVIAIYTGGEPKTANQVIGSFHFVPPIADDSSMILTRNTQRAIEFVACYSGRVIVHQDKLYMLPLDIPGQITDFDVSNSMKALCGFIPPFGKGKPLNLDIVLTFLAYNKVKFGVRNDRIESALTICNSERKQVNGICIAEGMRKIDGKNAVLEMEFGNKVKYEEFQIGADGKIDYHRKVIIPTTKKGELLAKVTLPTSGQPGMDVFGNMIMASPGKPLPMSAGEGVYTTEDGREFYAACVGQVNYGPDSISVLPVYCVEGDVDVHSGNIEFEGNILIKGSILNGFSVKAKGNIEVLGDIQSANVDAGRDLTVAGGIFGGANILVKVGRTLVARHLQNAIVEVEGDVHVRNSSLYSTVETTGQFFCVDMNGVVMGGTIVAMHGGRVKEVGGESGVKTVIVCGQDYLIQKKVREAKHLRGMIEEDLKKLDVYLKPILLRIQESREELSQEQKTKMTALIAYRKRLNMNLTVLANRVRRLENSAVIPDDIKFHVYKKVYPGAVVQICGHTWAPTKEYEHVVITKDPKTGGVKHQPVSKFER